MLGIRQAPRAAVLPRKQTRIRLSDILSDIRRTLTGHHHTRGKV